MSATNIPGVTDLAGLRAALEAMKEIERSDTYETDAETNAAIDAWCDLERSHLDRMASLPALTPADLLIKAEVAIEPILDTGPGAGARWHITDAQAELLESVLRDIQALAGETGA